MICVSVLWAPQYSTFACCLIPVLTLVVLLVMLDDIDDISFSKRRYFLIVSWMSISVYCIPTRDTHITRDIVYGETHFTGIHISLWHRKSRWFCQNTVKHDITRPWTPSSGVAWQRERGQNFRERLSEMRTRQPRKVIWDMINTLFVTTEAVEPTFVAFL